MEFDITSVIEKFLAKLLNGTRFAKLVEVYRRYCVPANFTIVCLVGVLLYNMLTAVFASAGLVGVLLSFGVAWGWMYSMTVGAFGYIWGFKDVRKRKVGADVL